MAKSSITNKPASVQIKWKSIIWTNDGLKYWRIYAFSLNELMLIISEQMNYIVDVIMHITIYLSCL